MLGFYPSYSCYVGKRVFYIASLTIADVSLGRAAKLFRVRVAKS